MRKETTTACSKNAKCRVNGVKYIEMC